ncbi:MAG: hypothetical protein JW895_03085 [Thermoleophilaceae bacterium]|nr:hypothetical protein [Thermoleophilaceae bacterium]
MNRLVANALGAAGAWLLESPAEPAMGPTPAARARPVVAVFGLAPGCGATVVARALAAELGARDPRGAAAVGCDAPGAGLALATAAAGRLARVLADVPGAHTRAVGRLCLVGGADPLALADCCRHHAPLVVDAGSGALGGRAAVVADATVLVASPSSEPALAAVAAACIAGVGPEPVTVVNGAVSARTGLSLPRSRVGAGLALAGREPPGEAGRTLARLADLVEEAS